MLLFSNVTPYSYNNIHPSLSQVSKEIIQRIELKHYQTKSKF